MAIAERYVSLQDTRIQEQRERVQRLRTNVDSGITSQRLIFVPTGETTERMGTIGNYVPEEDISPEVREWALKQPIYPNLEGSGDAPAHVITIDFRVELAKAEDFLHRAEAGLVIFQN